MDKTSTIDLQPAGSSICALYPPGYPDPTVLTDILLPTSFISAMTSAVYGALTE